MINWVLTRNSFSKKPLYYGWLLYSCICIWQVYREWFSSPPSLLHSDDCKDYEHFRQCMAILLEHEFESKGGRQTPLPTYLKGPRTFDLLLNIGFYDGVCLIACQPRPITYFEPKFSTLARKLHQTEINTYIISYILHLLLLYWLKWFFFKFPSRSYSITDHRKRCCANLPC